MSNINNMRRTENSLTSNLEKNKAVHDYIKKLCSQNYSQNEL